MSLPKVYISLNNYKNKKYNLREKVLSKSIGTGTNDEEENEIFKFNKKSLLSPFKDYNNNKIIKKKDFINKEFNTQRIGISNNESLYEDILHNKEKINSFKVLNNKIKYFEYSPISSSRNSKFVFTVLSKNKIKNKSKNFIRNKKNLNLTSQNQYGSQIQNNFERSFNNTTSSNQSKYINNKFIKSHFTLKPQKINNNYVSVKHNFLRFRKNGTKKIVSDDKTLMGSLFKQTKSNFNNKYKIQYFSNDMKKREQIKKCFSLIKKENNLFLIDSILNGKKKSQKNKNQTQLNLTYEDNINIKLKKIRNKKIITINSLEQIRPLTSKKLINEI